MLPFANIIITKSLHKNELANAINVHLIILILPQYSLNLIKLIFIQIDNEKALQHNGSAWKISSKHLGNAGAARSYAK